MGIEHMEATRFKPGQTGNPKGCPKGPKMLTLLKKALKVKVNQVDPATNEPRKMTLGEIAMLALVKQATKGNVRAINSIIDRMDGKVVQGVEMTGPGGSLLVPPQIIFQGVKKEVEGKSE